MRGLDPLRDLARALIDQNFTRRRYRPRGGSASVGPSDTIGQSDCWCGRPQNHDWPMKDIGAAHPRWEQ